MEYNLWDTMLKMFVTSTYNTTHLGWALRVAWILCTISSHLPLITTLNWSRHKWVENVSWNWRHKALLTNWDTTSPIVIDWMVSKGLVNVNSFVAPRVQASSYALNDMTCINIKTYKEQLGKFVSWIFFGVEWISKMNMPKYDNHPPWL